MPKTSFVTHDNPPSPPARQSGPFVSPGKRSLALFIAVVIAWTALAWVAVERRVEARAAALIAQRTAAIGEAVSTIGANVDRAFSRLQGLAAVLGAGADVQAALASFGPDAAPSTLAYADRKTAWERRADLIPLNGLLKSAVEDFGIDIIWVLNAGGDCVAASNAEEKLSFVGTHYGDREYFTAPRGGQRGRQFAVGRVTKVPGMFFSAPVTARGRFVGAVAAKSDLSRIASMLNHPNAFLADGEGVVILAANPDLEMRALPGAAVHGMSPEQRKARYMRKDFATLDAGEPGRDALLWLSESRHPHVAARSDLPQHGVTVHIIEPLPQLAALRSDGFFAFALLAALGALLAALAWGARAYLVRARHYRASLEAKNAQLSRANEHLDRLAGFDAVTGLHNARALRDVLAREVAKARRAGTSVAAIMLDLDHFKHFNDTWGHEAGNTVLARSADTVRACIRESDIACRYGGEELVVILPQATREVALVRAETMRRALEAMRIVHAGTPLGTVTASLGVAAFPADGVDEKALLNAADGAMYEAKRAGRNRTVGARGGADAGSAIGTTPPPSPRPTDSADTENAVQTEKITGALQYQQS